MGIHASVVGKFSHVQACKNPDYAQLLFFSKASAGGLTGIPSKPNLRVTVPSGSDYLQSFEANKNYHLGLDVSVSQPNQKYPRASLNYEIIEFKAA